MREGESGRLAGPAAAAVVLASGAGTRVGSERNKVYLPLGGSSVVSWSLRTFAGVAGIGVLVLVIRPQDSALAARVLDTECAGRAVQVVHGGATRHDSELMALRHLAPRITGGEIDVVLIHDAARPLVSPGLVAAVLDAARESGGAVPGVPRDGLTMASEDGSVAEADLGTMMAMQTPQGFAAAPLLDAYERAAADGFAGTDTAACVARYSDIQPRCIPGDDRNVKITYPHDLVVAAKSLAPAVTRPDRAGAGPDRAGEVPGPAVTRPGRSRAGPDHGGAGPDHGGAGPDHGGARRTVAVVLGGDGGDLPGSDVPALLVPLAGQPLIEHPVAAFETAPLVDEILVVAPPALAAQVRRLLAGGGYRKVSGVIEGAASRTESAWRAIAALGGADGIVLIHDAARPLVSQRVIEDCVAVLGSHHAVCAAVPAGDTMVTVEKGLITERPPRDRLRRRQSPQGFRLPVIRRGYELARADPGFEPADDCGIVLRYLPGVTVRLVWGSEQSFPVTRQADIDIAEALLAPGSRQRRGAGYGEDSGL